MNGGSRTKERQKKKPLNFKHVIRRFPFFFVVILCLPSVKEEKSNCLQLWRGSICVQMCLKRPKKKKKKFSRQKMLLVNNHHFLLQLVAAVWAPRAPTTSKNKTFGKSNCPNVTLKRPFKSWTPSAAAPSSFRALLYKKTSGALILLIFLSDWMGEKNNEATIRERSALHSANSGALLFTVSVLMQTKWWKRFPPKNLL